VRDIGTVIVTCPSEMNSDPFFHTVDVEGGCSYERAVWMAGQKAAAVGADGLRAVETSANTTGRIVRLMANAFVYLPKPKPVASPAPASAEPKDTSVEARLRHLEKLKTEKLITPEEYDARRAAILNDI
jgi:hypothetical protein